MVVGTVEEVEVVVAGARISDQIVGQSEHRGNVLYNEVTLEGESRGEGTETSTFSACKASV